MLLTAENVREHRGMPDLLVCHELDEESVISVDAGGLKLLHGELGQAVVEQIELDPFLVQRKILG